MITMPLNDPYDFIRVIVQAQACLAPGYLWWRGHDQSHWKLRPDVYRDDVDKKRDRLFELGTAYRFDRQAPARYPNWPETYHEQLLLMQHYGLPTRLLDWTESPLIALCFAVSTKSPNPAALWAINPLKLNREQHGEGKVFPAGHSAVRQIFAEAFDDVEADTNRIVAINPPHIDIRLLIQQSEFTIHGTREPLEQLKNNENFGMVHN